MAGTILGILLTSWELPVRLAREIDDRRAHPEVLHQASVSKRRVAICLLLLFWGILAISVVLEAGAAILLVERALTGTNTLLGLGISRTFEAAVIDLVSALTGRPADAGWFAKFLILAYWVFWQASG